MPQVAGTPVTQVPIVYVYLGNRLPDYARHSLSIARKNLDGPIHVLTDQDPLSTVTGVNFIDISPWYHPQPFQEFAENSRLDALFRGGFWLKAVERFFVLEQYQRFRGLKRFFHAELDVLVFNLEGLADALDRGGAGIFIPSQRPGRAIASLIYLNEEGVLAELVNFFKQNSHLGNEMNMLGRFLSERPDVGFALPSENALDLSSRSVAEPGISIEEGLVDSAGFGQWLLGYDPRNVVGTSWNKFREANEGADFSRFFFRAAPVPRRLEISSDKKRWLRIRAVHVHSKVFYRLRIPGVLSFYAWISRFPIRFPIVLSLGGIKCELLNRVLSRRSGSVLSNTPAKVRFFFAGVMIQLISQAPKVLSERERRVALTFLEDNPLKSGAHPALHRNPDDIDVARTPESLEKRLRALGRKSRNQVESQIRIFLDALTLTEPAVYLVDEARTPNVGMIRGNKQLLFVTDDKHYMHSKHALTFWSQHHLNNSWSFVGPFQLVNPEVVKEMFPGGEQDIFRWAEMGLRAKMDSLSAFQSYGTYLFSRYRKRVRLAPFTSL